MWKSVKGLLAELFTSKKFVATVAGGVVALCAKLGFAASNELVLGILGLVGTYVLGQGIADNGKSAAKVNAETYKDL